MAADFLFEHYDSILQLMLTERSEKSYQEPLEEGCVLPVKSCHNCEYVLSIFERCALINDRING